MDFWCVLIIQKNGWVSALQYLILESYLFKLFHMYKFYAEKKLEAQRNIVEIATSNHYIMVK